jgi:predicted HTH domain antitoxin
MVTRDKNRLPWPRGWCSLKPEEGDQRYSETDQQGTSSAASPLRTDPLWLAILRVLGYNDATRRKERKMERLSTVDWEIEQLVKARLFPDQQAVVRSALRALFQAQPGMRRQMIVSAYTSGDISLGKAAKLMGVSHEEMKDILVENGAEVHLGPRTAEEVLQDAANA